MNPEFMKGQQRAQEEPRNCNNSHIIALNSNLGRGNSFVLDFRVDGTMAFVISCVHPIPQLCGGEERESVSARRSSFDLFLFEWHPLRRTQTIHSLSLSLMPESMGS